MRMEVALPEVGVSHTVGLVGGLGVGATIHYYERLAKALAGQAATPSLLISHANLTHVLGLIGRNEPDALADYLMAGRQHLPRHETQPDFNSAGGAD
jgi:aspartate racemase